MKRLLVLIVVGVLTASVAQAADTVIIHRGSHRLLPGGSRLALLSHVQNGKAPKMEIAFRWKQIREVNDTQACLAWKEVTGKRLGTREIWYEYRIEWHKTDCTLTSYAPVTGTREIFPLPLEQGRMIQKFVLQAPKPKTSR